MGLVSTIVSGLTERFMVKEESSVSDCCRRVRDERYLTLTKQPIGNKRDLVLLTDVNVGLLHERGLVSLVKL